MCVWGRRDGLVEAGRLRQARDRNERIAKARASEAGGAAAAGTAVAAAALAAAAATAAAAADSTTCGDKVQRAACVHDSVGMQRVMQEGDGGGKDSSGDAGEETNAAVRGGGARGGGVPKTRIGLEEENVEVEDGAGAQAGTAVAAARPAEATRLVVGRGREVSYERLAAAPAQTGVDVDDAPRDATGTENRKRSNELMRNCEEGIMLGENVDGLHSRQRRRTEKRLCGRNRTKRTSWSEEG